MVHSHVQGEFDDVGFEGKSLVEKIRWSVRQRLQKQLRQMCEEFFDAADDFLFASSQQKHTDAENPYLNSMREIRTKQSLFEDSLVTSVLAVILESQQNNCPNIRHDLVIEISHAAAFERVEIDLAIRRMLRKAQSRYGEFYAEIDGINLRFEKEEKPKIISSKILVKGVLQGFEESQALLLLPVEVRLIFLKLFEQHFLLKMDRLFLDFKSILENYEDPVFAEKLVSSSSSFYKKASACEHSQKLSQHRHSLSDKSKALSAEVQAAVTEFISELCDSHRMPLFIEKMIRQQWRSVMFLVGLNSGCDSAAWNESKYTMLMLASAAAAGSQISFKEKQLITEQIESGFSLIQVSRECREAFMTELGQHFSKSNKTEIVSRSRMSPDVSIDRFDSESQSEVQQASISPAGKKVLDHADLDELASLLGGGTLANEATPSDSELDDFLIEIDNVVSGQQAHYFVAGQVRSCSLVKTTEDFFEIQFEDSRTVIKKSRLGLALTLKEGNLKLTRAKITRSISSVTVFDRKLH